jgi:sugar phosphate isomerase/epimerase
MLQFGLRAHDFGQFPADRLAEVLHAYGPACIQLALTKAFPDTPKGGGFLSPGYARRVRRAFDARGIGIAVLGCYINPVTPDPAERERQLRRFEEHLRFVRDFGCAIVGTETGSLNPDCSYNPGTQDETVFDTLCAAVERLARAAERCGAIVGIEPVAWQHTLSTVARTARLLERVDSPALGIIFDPVNLIPREGLGERSHADFMTEAMDTFGDRIVAVHAKDYRMIGGRKTEGAAAGTGIFDFDALFRLLQARKPDIDVLLENASPATAAAALAFVAEAAARTAP